MFARGFLLPENLEVKALLRPFVPIRLAGLVASR